MWRYTTIAFISALFHAVALDAAQVIAENSSFKKRFLGNLELQLATDEVVPVKVRYQTEPYRVILEFDHLDFGDLPFDFGHKVRDLQNASFGEYQGASRMVLSFDKPIIVNNLDFSDAAVGGKLGLKAEFEVVSPESFEAQSANLTFDGDDGLTSQVPLIEETGKVLVVLDPGHGGVDPGAVRNGVSEKQITLRAAEIIRDRLEASGHYDVVLTREGDTFSSLLSRRQFAERVGGDVLLSIHADTVEVGDAKGTTIYQLSDKATNQIAAHFAEFENRADLFAGEFAEVKQNDLALVLTDLAHQSSREKAAGLARILQRNFIDINKKAEDSRIESAAFAVLKAPEIPSLLIEIGYLSNDEDLVRMRDEAWLQKLSEEVLQSLNEFFAPSISSP